MYVTQFMRRSGMPLAGFTALAAMLLDEEVDDGSRKDSRR
jgi:hypothetical protein